MTLVLRVLKRRANWIREDAVPFDGLRDAPADTLNCFATKEDELSFFEYADEEQLGRLVAAFCANRSSVDALDVVTFSPDVFEQANTPIERTPGDLLDPEANKLHIAAKNLTAIGLAELVNLVWLSPTRQLRRFMKDQVAELIAEALRNNRISADRLSPEILRNLRRSGKAE